MKKYLLSILFLLLTVNSAVARPVADMENGFSSPRTTALGMAGAADNSVGDIFINQFGLAGLESYGVYASSYKLFMDTNFTNVQAYVPIGAIGLGIGYRLKTIDSVQVTPPDIFDDITGRPDLSRMNYLSYQQSILYVAMGYSGLFGWQNLDLGVAYKNYSIQNSLRREVSRLSAQGNNIDIGLLARLNKGWSLSLVCRNVLSSEGMGGGLVWRNGTTEQMLRSVTLGNKFSFNEGRLLYFLDANYYENDFYPPLLSMGMESRFFSDVFVFRGGVRQYALLTAADEQRVFNAVSAGLGFVPLPGVRFDYAYYPGDALGLETVHYAGAGLDFGDIFGSMAALFTRERTEAPMPAESLQVITPQDFFVIDGSELLCNLQIQGYSTVNINGSEHGLNPRHRRFTTTIDIEPGANQIQIAAQSRQLRRNVLRLKTADELQDARQDKDMVQNVFTLEQRQRFDDQKIKFQDFAAYLVQSLDLRLPKDFENIFTDMDILYFNGFLGKVSEGLLQPEDGYFSVGRLAEILARIDGYGDVLDSSADTQLQAIKVLISTGYYTAADFAPREAEVTLAKAQSLFMRTAAANKRLYENFNGFPLVWLDRTDLNNGRLTLRIYNAERFEKFNWTYGRLSASGNIEAENYVSINIAPLRQPEAAVITINVYDKPGKVWQFTAVLPPARISAEPAFSVRLEPRGLEAGARLRINFGVPEGVQATRVVLSSPSLLRQPINLTKISSTVWQAEIPVPETARTGEYVLAFKVEGAERSYEKKFPVQVRGFENVQPQTGIIRPGIKTGARIITKTSKPVYKPQDTILAYIGVVGNPAAVREARVVFPDGAFITASKQGTNVWRAELDRFTAGRNEYTAVVYFHDGAVSEQPGSFRVDGAMPVSRPQAQPAQPTRTVTASQPADTNRQRLNRVYYPVEIMLSPARPQPGSRISIRAKYESTAVETVYAQVKGQRIPMRKNGDIWQAEYSLPSQKGDVYIQIYAQDKQGNLSMTEKLLVL